MKCRVMRALDLLALEPIAETTADLNSYGFKDLTNLARSGHSQHVNLYAALPNFPAITLPLATVSK